MRCSVRNWSSISTVESDAALEAATSSLTLPAAGVPCELGVAAAVAFAGFAGDDPDEESEVVPAAWPLLPDPERLDAALRRRLAKPPAGLAGAAGFLSLVAVGSLAPLARVARDSAEEVSAKVDGDEAAIARATCEAPTAAQGELRLITCVTAGVGKRCS